MATELRKRGVPPWEVSGMLGHRASEYKTTEIYAHYAPDYLGEAAKAVDSYFIELQKVVAKPLILKKEENLRVSRSLYQHASA